MSRRYPPQHQYVARLLPLDQELVVHDSEHGVTRERWPSGSFAHAQNNPANVRVLVNHDETLEAARLDRLYERAGWLCAAFRLRDDPIGNTVAEQIKIGTPVSIGAKIHRLGSIDIALLEEVSIVRHGAYPGAEIIDRVTMLWSPPATWPIERNTTETPNPSPPAPTPATVPGSAQVIYGGGLLRRPDIGQVLGVR